MGNVIIGATISLDGFMSDRNGDLSLLYPDLEALGQTEMLREEIRATGAVVMGRRLFDVVDGPDGWNDDVGYGYDQDQSAAPLCYVVTHEPPAQVRLGPRFRFVTAGVAAAVEQARATAGDKDVVVRGGANVIDQCLAEGLVDVLTIHLSPLLIGGGTRLFDLTGPTTLVQRSVVESPRATHLTYDVVRG